MAELVHCMANRQQPRLERRMQFFMTEEAAKNAPFVDKVDIHECALNNPVSLTTDCEF
jgi:hypothetical protein